MREVCSRACVRLGEGGEICPADGLGNVSRGGVGHEVRMVLVGDSRVGGCDCGEEYVGGSIIVIAGDGYDGGNGVCGVGGGGGCGDSAGLRHCCCVVGGCSDVGYVHGDGGCGDGYFVVNGWWCWQWP